jgi:DNA-binding response OmpR family regulator
MRSLDASISGAGPPTVLLVEDSALVAMLLADEIEGAGCKVEQAADGTAALSLIASVPHLDAAVVNLNLGFGPCGKQIVRSLRSRWVSLPIIVVTGYVATGPEADLRGLGGPTVRLHKPVDLEELRSLLASLSADGWPGLDAASRSRRKGECELGALGRPPEGAGSHQSLGR